MLGGGEIRDALIGSACVAVRPLFRSRARVSRLPPNTSRIVIIKPASIGDVLMATPTLVALRRAFPQARLDFAVGAWSRPAIEGHPALDGLVDLGPLGGHSVGLGDYFAAVRLLRTGRYEAAFVLDRSPLVSLLPHLAGIPFRAGLDSENRGFSLGLRVGCPSDRHEAELYLDTIRAAGIAIGERRLVFVPSKMDRQAADALLATHASPKAAFVAVHPGGGVNPGMSLPAKRWSPAGFAVLADRLVRELGATALLLGGPGDHDVVAQVRGGMESEAINLSGKLTWGQLGAVLERCRVLVANDTGAAHLATAVGASTVVLFGPTSPLQYGPVAGYGEAITLSLPCSPCFRRGRMPPCPFSFRCLNDLEVDAVWTAVLRQWTSSSRRCVRNGEA